MDEVWDVVILGGACAGYTAAVYSSRALLKTLLLAGPQPGGQLMLTTLVENYPGFPDGVLGPELMERFKQQAERFGTQVVHEAATRVDFSVHPFKIWREDQLYPAKVVIVATGATPRKLGLPSEAHLFGHGVSTCATCDGFFFRGRDVAVVGGGDTAMEEALFLAHLHCQVTVIHRRDQLRASRIIQERAFKEPRISFRWNSVVEEVLGEQRVEGVRILNVKDGGRHQLAFAALFVAIGYEPNTAIFHGQLAMDQAGYLMVHDETHTSVEGVFAAGDVHDARYRQAVTAAGDGCKAAMDAEKWLREKGLA